MSDRIYDFTTLDTFQTCRRKYYYFAVRNLQTKTKSNALLFGGAIHNALDIYYIARKAGEDGGMEKAITAFEQEFVDREGDEIRTLATGTKLLRNYADVYANEPFVVVGKPETGFVYPIDDVLMGGRMDLLVEWDDVLWVMEHKTTSKIGASYFKQFALDKQITGYIVGAETYTGRKVMGCMVNVLQPWKEVKRVSAKTKTMRDHYMRDPMTRSPALKERYKLNIQRIVRDIEWCEANNEFYEAEKKEACFYYNYDCPYRQLCQFGEDEKLIEQEYVVSKWEPYKIEDTKEESDV